MNHFIVTLCYGVLTNDINAESREEALKIAKQYYMKTSTNSNRAICHIDRPDSDGISVADVNVLIQVAEEILTHTKEGEDLQNDELLKAVKEARIKALDWRSAHAAVTLYGNMKGKRR